MRIFIAFFLLAFLCPFSLADVVVNNIGITSTSTAMPEFLNSITFTPTQTGTFGTLFTIKVQNRIGSTANLLVMNCNFDNGIGSKTGVLAGGVAITEGNFGEFQYNLGNISYTSGVAKTITFSIPTQSTGAIIGWATAGTGTYGGAWGSGASASATNGMYSVAVPEPGTMWLGGFLAAGSGAGFWWSRRKKEAAKD